MSADNRGLLSSYYISKYPCSQPSPEVPLSLDPGHVTCRIRQVFRQVTCRIDWVPVETLQGTCRILFFFRQGGAHQYVNSNRKNLTFVSKNFHKKQQIRIQTADNFIDEGENVVIPSSALVRMPELSSEECSGLPSGS